MSVLSFRRRLETLEAMSALEGGQPKRSPLYTLLEGLIAYHLGDAGPNESIAEGMARGLGYEKGRDLMDGLRADAGTLCRDGLNARWREATDRLFGLKGTTPDCDGPTFAVTLMALYRELPDRMRTHPFMAGCEGLFEAA